MSHLSHSDFLQILVCHQLEIYRLCCLYIKRLLKKLKLLFKANIPLFFLLSFLIVFLYINSITGKFLVDDIPGFVENPSVINGIWSVETFRFQNLMYALIYKVFGLNNVILHLISIAVHIINSILVFVFLFMLFGKRVAGIATFLFAAHPVNSEKVSWISANNYLFNGTLTLLILITYFLYRNSGRKTYYITSLLIYILGLGFLGHQWIMITPAFILIFDMYFLKNNMWKKFLYVLPFIIPTILYFFFYVNSNLINPRIEHVSFYNESRDLNIPWIMRAPYSIYTSVKLLVYPSNLSIYHEVDPQEQNLQTAQLLSLIIISIIIFLFFYNRKMSLLMFLIYVSLIPVFAPQMVTWVTAERYLYLAVVFYSVIITKIILGVSDKFDLKKLPLISTLSLLILYSYIVITRNNDWQSEKSLWASTVNKTPFPEKVYNNLGETYYKENDFPNAALNFSNAIKINPIYSFAYHNLARVYLVQKNYELAELGFKKATDLNPTLYQAWFGLATIEVQKNDYAKAVEYLNMTLEVKPDYEKAINLLSKLNPSQ